MYINFFKFEIISHHQNAPQMIFPHRLGREVSIRQLTSSEQFYKVGEYVLSIKMLRF